VKANEKNGLKGALLLNKNREKSRIFDMRDKCAVDVLGGF
jgi:hypothetical protein